MTPLWQTPPPPKPPPLHVAAFESVTIPAWSRSLIPVYLTGTGRLEEEMNKVQNFYIRPFASETSVDVPQIAAHAIIDSSKPVSMVEVMNVWPNPINITKDMPVGLVDTINPEIAELPNGTEKGQVEASLEPRTLPPDRKTDSHMLATPTDLEALTDPPTGADLSAIQGDLSDTRTRCGPPLGIHNTDPDITSPKAVRLARRPQVTETVQTEEKSEVDDQRTDCLIQTHAFSTPFTDTPPPESPKPKGGVEMEDLIEHPDDERIPTNNLGMDESEIIMIETSDETPPVMELGANECREEEEVPGLIDAEDEDRGEDEDGREEQKEKKEKNPFELNMSGMMFTGENKQKFLDLCEKYKDIFATSVSTC